MEKISCNRKYGSASFMDGFPDENDKKEPPVGPESKIVQHLTNLWELLLSCLPMLTEDPDVGKERIFTT